jgi:hypothetical protein
MINSGGFQINSRVRIRIGMPKNPPNFFPFSSAEEAGRYPSPRKQTKSACAFCGVDKAADNKKLKKCSRCSLVYYCCQDHQVQDYKKQHKTTCRAIAELDRSIPLTKEKLYPDGSPYPDDEAFSVYIDSVHKRLGLVHEAARQQKSRPLYEKLVADYDELYRNEDHADWRSVKARFPLLLLELERDKDAVRLCRFWFAENDNHEAEISDDEFDQILKPIYDARRDSKKGEWVYGSANGEEEIVQDFLAGKRYQAQRQMNTLLLLVSCLAKMRLVATRGATIAKYKIFLSTNVGKKLSPVKSIFEGMLFGEKKHLLTEMIQMQSQIPELLVLIHDNNANLLPAILNPEPFYQQVDLEEVQQWYADNEHKELNETLKYARDVWYRTPGAVEYLQRCFGQKPMYQI